MHLGYANAFLSALALSEAHFPCPRVLYGEHVGASLHGCVYSFSLYE